jgi:hypothetical protein
MGDIRIRVIYETEGDVVFVYSHQNGAGRPEFIALDVPRSKANTVARSMNFLAPRTIMHGQNVHSHGLYLITNLVEGHRKASLLQTHARCPRRS